MVVYQHARHTKKSGTPNGVPDIYRYSIFTSSLDRPFLRDPQGTTCGCATCDLSLMDSPITRRCLE